jgi:hypothetical protein
MILHARATNTLLHANKTAGERTSVLLAYTMTDESGNVFTDESGNEFILYGETSLPVLHASMTNTLLHAEATNG